MLDVWQNNYEKLDAANARLRKDIEVLETERQRIFDIHRAGNYTPEEFLEQKELINLKIAHKRRAAEDTHIEEFDMDEALEFAFKLVRHSSDTWRKLESDPVLRSRFQKQLFPEKIVFDGKKFGTAKMSLILRVNQDTHTDPTKLVSPLSLGWNSAQNMVLQWNQVFGMVNVMGLEPEYA